MEMRRVSKNATKTSTISICICIIYFTLQISLNMQLDRTNHIFTVFSIFGFTDLL